MKTKPIEVWTDGSCYPNPGGPGGWAFVAVWGDVVARRCGPMKSTTNNEAELTAIYRALCFVDLTEDPMTITTDSQYAYRAITVWHFGWAENEWTNSSGRPVANVELIKKILALIAWHREVRALNFKWTRGHAGTPLNEEADVLADKARVQSLQLDKNCEDPIH